MLDRQCPAKPRKPAAQCEGDGEHAVHVDAETGAMRLLSTEARTWAPKRVYSSAPTSRTVIVSATAIRNRR